LGGDIPHPTEDDGDRLFLEPLRQAPVARGVAGESGAVVGDRVPIGERDVERAAEALREALDAVTPEDLADSGHQALTAGVDLAVQLRAAVFQLRDGGQARG